MRSIFLSFEVLVVLPRITQATPSTGEYSNMEKGDLIVVGAGVASCGDKERITHIRQMFLNTHLRLTAKSLDVAGLDSGEPGTPTTSVTRADSYVIGWLDTHQDVEGGRVWEVVAVKDPDGTMHEQMQVGLVVKKDGNVTCGDAVIGIAMRQDLRKPDAPKTKPVTKPKK